MVAVSLKKKPGVGATLQAGIFNLPHPASGSGGFTCTSCHSSPTGGRKAIGYDHKSTLINANCDACHEAGSDLVSTAWNASTSAGAGAGDTRPFTLAGLVPSTKANTRALSNSFNHFYPVDCHECHDVPTGTGAASAGTAYRAAWRLDHTEANMTNPSTCNMCHAAPNNIPEN